MDLIKDKKLDCLTCHAVDKKLVGPSWNEIGAKYRGQAGAKATLIKKVKKGGSGNGSCCDDPAPHRQRRRS